MTLLERLRAARQQSLTRMTDVLAAMSDGDGREPTDEETALLTRERAAVEALDAQITAETDRQIADAKRSADLALATREAPRTGVPLGGAVITRSEPVYRADRDGHRYFRDLLYASGQASDQTPALRAEAEERLGRAHAYAADEGARYQRERHTRAAGTTAGASGGAFVPPGYRPDLFVARPVDPPTLWDALGAYPIADATPFSIPRTLTGTVVGDQAAEGNAPVETNLTGELLTITPVTKTGKNTWSRQAIEGSNPAIDQIVADDLTRELNWQLEQLAAETVFASLNTDTVTGVGEELLDQMTASAYVLAGFRKQPPQAYVTGWAEAGALAAAKGTDGRKLLPNINPTNAAGTTGEGLAQTWENMPVLHSGAAPALKTAVLRLSDVAAFGSPVLNFYFVEKEGPEKIVLGVWQYAAAVIRQPLGVRVVVRTAPAARAGKA